jgi:hypothetical protein
MALSRLEAALHHPVSFRIYGYAVPAKAFYDVININRTGRTYGRVAPDLFLGRLFPFSVV